jgi:hypothetical protein
LLRSTPDPVGQACAGDLRDAGVAAPMLCGDDFCDTGIAAMSKLKIDILLVVYLMLVLLGVFIFPRLGKKPLPPRPEPHIIRLAPAPDVRRVAASPDGSRIAWVSSCRGNDCELWVSSTSTAAPARLSQAISPEAKALAWASQDDVLAFVENAPDGPVLYASTGGSPPRSLARGVGGFQVGCGAIAFWIGRGLGVASPDGRPIAGPVADVVALEMTACTAPEPVVAVAIRGASARDLVAVRRDGRIDVLAHAVDRFWLSPDGGRVLYATAGSTGGTSSIRSVEPKATPRVLGPSATAVAFDSSSAAVAFIARDRHTASSDSGDLWIARGEGRAEQVANGVSTVRWSRSRSVVAWLQDFNERTATGHLAALGPDGDEVVFDQRASGFDLAPDGSTVAFVEGRRDLGDLWISRTDPASRPRRLDRAVWRYAFSPGGAALFYQTSCSKPEGPCRLDRIGVRPEVEPRPRKFAGGVQTFTFDPFHPGRVILENDARRAGVEVEVANGKDSLRIEWQAVPGMVTRLGASGRIAYVTMGTPPEVAIATIPEAM